MPSVVIFFLLRFGKLNTTMFSQKIQIAVKIFRGGVAKTIIFSSEKFGPQCMVFSSFLDVENDAVSHFSKNDLYSEISEEMCSV